QLTNGLFNIGIGDSALYSLTTGGRNIAIGNAVLPKITTVSGLISIGDSSGYKNTSGNNNIFIGEKAGYANSVGGTNILIGANAGKNMLGGEGNVFIGDSTGASMTSAGAFSSVFIGDKAGSKTNQDPNTFIGNFSGYVNTSGNSNSFMGTLTGWQNTTGSYNTFLGEFSGYNNVSGQRNTLAGCLTGYSNTGNDNLFAGYQSGNFNVSGSGNTIIGSDADVLKNNLSNAGAIGYLAAVDTSNALVLGSINGVNGATAQANVGIGTTKPLAMLHVKDSSVLFSGPAALPVTPGDPPQSGDGIRMMWYPAKAAFRAGRAGPVNWDKDSIGLYSFAAGYGTRAKGNYATSIGYFCYATGTYAVSLGYNTSAHGNYGFSAGQTSHASGLYSVAMGQSSVGYGRSSVGIGENGYATGDYSTSFGFASTASGENSFVKGYFSTADGDKTVCFGDFTRAKSYNSFVMGRYNDTTSSSSTAWVATDPVFVIGNGTTGNRRNAFIITKEGETGINVANGVPQALLHLKAKEATYDMHIRLENVSNTDYASMVYDGSMKFRTFGTDDEYQWRNAANSTTMRLTNNGELGINTAAPQAKLDAAGTFKLGTNGTVNYAILRDTISIATIFLAANSGTTYTFFLPNIAADAVVSVSPSAALPDGVVIAWARAQTGAIEFRLRNVTGALITAPGLDFYYSVIQ
ncbi:MAG TPA: hypothetical protein PKJ94_10710, partial [Ferruginibacter sp.]|nr:hypothetical protein [Ferruginibacter sp.]